MRAEILALSVCLIGSILPAVGQQSKTDATAQWQYVKKDDPLHAKVHDQLILEGVYLTPPRTAGHGPSIVVECSDGKVEQNYFSVGAVIVDDPAMHRKVLILDGRIDGKQTAFLSTGLSTDGQSVFFTRYDLKDILHAKQVIVGAYEYLGAQVAMRFDIPDPSPVMEKCGGDRMLREKKAK